jgi:hypothetical protein
MRRRTLVARRQLLDGDADVIVLADCGERQVPVAQGEAGSLGPLGPGDVEGGDRLGRGGWLWRHRTSVRRGAVGSIAGRARRGGWLPGCSSSFGDVAGYDCGLISYFTSKVNADSLQIVTERPSKRSRLGPGPARTALFARLVAKEEKELAQNGRPTAARSICPSVAREPC